MPEPVRVEPAKNGDGNVERFQEEWLEMLAVERDWLLMRLRQIEPVLIRHGRLRYETPRRIR